MVSRELLSSQSILSSYSAKTTGGTSTQTSDQSFLTMLKGKQELTSSKVVETPRKEARVNSETSNDLRNVTDDDVKTENQNTSKVDGQEKTEKPEEVEEIEEVAADSSTKDVKSKNADREKVELLKDKLKEAGLSDDEISMLMALLGSTFTDLIEQMPLEQIQTMDFENLVNVVQTLNHIEVNQELQLEPDQTLTQNLTSSLKQFVDTLEKVMRSDEQMSVDQVEDLMTALKGQIEKVVTKVDQNKDMPVQDVIRSMQDASSSKQVVNQSPDTTLRPEAQNVSDASISDKTEVSENLVQTESEEIDADLTIQSKEVGDVTTKSDEKAKSTTETKQTDNTVVVNQPQNQDQKIMETLIKSSEVRQVPRPEIFNQVLDAIKANISVSDTGSSMLLKLQPEQLGDVEVKVTINKGVVLAEIKVENETVKAAIETNLDQLKQSLTQKGYNTNAISVSIDSGKKEDEQSKAFEQAKRKQNNLKIDLDEETFVEKISSRYAADERYDSSTIDYFG